MRGADGRSGALFSYVDLEVRVPHGHPLRTIRLIVNEALAGLSPGFHDLYARIGRPSIPPEKLLRALLLQAFYSIRSERQLMERLDFDLLFRWFVGLGIDDPVWDHSTFQEPRSAAWRRRGGTVPRRSADPAQGPPPALGRALQRRWHAHRSLGVDEELPAPRCWRRGWFLRCRRAEPRCRLSW